MNKEEIYKSIVDWQDEAGEDFLDYFDSDVNVPNLMFWCLAKSYITKEQFNLWENDMSKKGFIGNCDSLGIVHDCRGENTPYAIVSEEDWTIEGQEKAYMTLSEFISESIIYQKRLKEFLADYE